jgi:hypothetical protein
MTTTYCDSGAVKLKAGSNVSSSITDAQYTQLINEAEAFINVAIKDNSYSFIDNYASINEDVKYILEDAASCHAAVSAISYDPTAYTKEEALIIINVNWARMQECIKMLRDKKYTDYIQGA